jgi:hypothetical protein
MNCDGIKTEMSHFVTRFPEIVGFLSLRPQTRPVKDRRFLLPVFRRSTFATS